MKSKEEYEMNELLKSTDLLKEKRVRDAWHGLFGTWAFGDGCQCLADVAFQMRDGITKPVFYLNALEKVYRKTQCESGYDDLAGRVLWAKDQISATDMIVAAVLAWEARK